MTRDRHSPRGTKCAMRPDPPGQPSHAVQPTHHYVRGTRSLPEAMGWTRSRNFQSSSYNYLTMDVVSGISLAASVASLLDCGLRLISNAKQISRSTDGSLDTKQELEEITTRINYLGKSLQGDDTETSPSVRLGNAKYRESIRHLATRSADVSNDLIMHLQALKARKSRGCYDVPLAAVRSMMGNGRTKALNENLDSLRRTLELFLVAQMSEKQDAFLLQLQEQMITGVKELERNREDVFGAIKQLDGNATQSLSYRRLSALLDELAKNSEEVIRTQILRSLAYDGMTTRQCRIPEAYQKTFEWVFKDPKLRFKDWLEADSTEHIYWVSGKPGSGKSTLMNFLYNHMQTRESLRVWAGPDRQLVLSSHFFWALGGSEKQKSLEGLLRSLLHGTLRQCPKLIPLVCPEHIQHTFNSGNRDPWKLAELQEGFAKITHLDQSASTKEISTSTRFCFFIDGLDEHIGQTADLIKLCKLTTRPTNVKICVASRSWPAFRDAFTGDEGHMLELHELTKGDIQSYAVNQLGDHSQVIEFQKEDSLAFASLVGEIVRKAQGVFLWVYLVVRSLLDGLSNEDSLSKLKERLQLLPDDLDEYYQHVMNAIETIYKKEATQVLKMFVCAEQSIPLLCLPPALQTLNYQTVDEEVARSTAWAVKSNNSIRKQLHARCRDFLQVELDPEIDSIAQHHNIDITDLVHLRYRVDFLHLTAKEFLKKRAVTQQLAGWDSNYIPNRILLCECYMFMLKILPKSVFERFGDIEILRGGVPRKYPILSFQKIAHEFWTIESMSGRAPWSMIDDYRKLIFSRTNGCTNHEPETQPKAIAWQSDTLRWALYWDLVVYAEMKIRQSSNFIPEVSKGVLLKLALQQSISKEEQPWTINARLYIVRTLLHCGANPNEITPGKKSEWSQWSRWLSDLNDCNSEYYVRHLKHLDPTSQRDTYGRDDWLALTDTLLEYGADPNITFSSVFLGPSSHVTAIEAIRKAFRPDQVEILMKRIRDPQKAGEPRSQAHQEQRLQISSIGADGH